MIANILDQIAVYETVIIHRHERPDPDALGSQLGLAALLKKRYPEKNIFAVGEEEPSLDFLGKMDTVSDEQYEGALVIVCDTANTARISDTRFDSGAYLIKIDHHPNEEPYGDLIWVDTSFSSVSEMIVELAVQGKERGLELDAASAELLYAGIVGDTGRFRFSNTSADTLRRTSLLVAEAFDQNAFYSNFHKKDLKMIRLQGYVLQHFSIIAGRVGVMRLTKELLEQFQVTANESSQLVNSFSDVEGLRTWVFFVEEDDQIRVRLRSKGPVINSIAAEHGGGGHPMAAGATAYSWEETEEIVAKLVQASS
ncbi:bifunctional oligoribonuclease/PAP phosphatase NrnA [Alkalihalobacillus oceani]|uniref:DHH family phosphoesterase n=1 Tax=Halalkalibacter oceani TaxID=1653776 RepID=UPI00203B3645|nr:bifunctional oligoribonuclease/PAP phosphatase NrnA [Halalkalibacter oceani]MCM3759658.1 bifunctional oligoribonuclease/PAP phosphatase NrnA [Halalkalibacter oceani]